MDPISAVFATFGVILIFAGWVHLIFTSFEDDYSWGLTTLFLPPISYLFACFVWDKTKGAMTLTIIGWLLILVGLY